MCYTIERGELLNEMSDLKKQERRYQRKNQKIERRRKREEHKQYKRKVKAGKWIGYNKLDKKNKDMIK